MEQIAIEARPEIEDWNADNIRRLTEDYDDGSEESEGNEEGEEKCQHEWERQYPSGRRNNE